MMEIRKCDAQDIDGTVRFYDGVVLWLNGHVNYPRWIYRIYPGEDSVREMTETGAQYICMSNNAIIGAFALNDRPQGKYQKGLWSRELEDGSYLVIHALAIDPRNQRQGIGSDIVRYCIEKARAEGFKAIRVDIVPTNGPARALFEKNGFAYAGDVDLELGIGDIPVFSLYELNII